MNNDTEPILNKARHYCAYQERCTKEVMIKLNGWKVKPAEAEKVIEQLREENFLDDERYARAYASGHFHSKQWGKTKITYELKGKGIPEEIIQLALEDIDDEDYEAALKELMEKKNREVKDKDAYVRKKKLISFALQKGYEYAVVKKVVDWVI